VPDGAIDARRRPSWQMVNMIGPDGCGSNGINAHVCIVSDRKPGTPIRLAVNVDGSSLRLVLSIPREVRMLSRAPSWLWVVISSSIVHDDDDDDLLKTITPQCEWRRRRLPDLCVLIKFRP
jgi:hypothetical protein